MRFHVLLMSRNKLENVGSLVDVEDQFVRALSFKTGEKMGLRICATKCPRSQN